MAYALFNHIQGKKGSRWAEFIRETGSENILMVAIDAAKYTQKVLICTFFGDILVKPFEFDASLTGFDYLKKIIDTKKGKFGYKEVVVGIETTGHYYEDLVRRCQLVGFHVRTLNAATTAQERETLLNWSKTDNLDLMAIVQSMIHGRGTSNGLPTGKVHNLQKLTRARRELVKEETETKNLIRVHMDHIFREFQGKSVWLNGKRTHVKIFDDMFGKSSIYLMKHYPHPSDIIKLGEEGLRQLSIRENLKFRDKSIHLLLDFARNSISQPREFLEVDIFLLLQKLERLELLASQIKVLERKIEGLFVETEGAVILSVPGIGVVTGAELFAEMGDLSDFDYAGQLIKLAGTNPIVKQSGGKRPSYHGISKQGRRSFRNITYQVGKSLAHNNPEMKQRYKAFKERGKLPNQSYIALGNRMIRLAFSMIRKHTLYRSSDKNYVLQDVLGNKLSASNLKKFYEIHVSPTLSQSA